MIIFPPKNRKSASQKCILLESSMKNKGFMSIWKRSCSILAFRGQDQCFSLNQPSAHIWDADECLSAISNRAEDRLSENIYFWAVTLITTEIHEFEVEKQWCDETRGHKKMGFFLHIWQYYTKSTNDTIL